MSEEQKIDKDYVDKRADGWISKVEKLYSDIKDALKGNSVVGFKSEQYMIMEEELMQKYGVPPKKVPIFDLFVGNQLKATFKPIGLWVVGARGRIDILTKEGSYILVDLGDDETHPNWKVFTPKNRKKSSPFDNKFLETLVH